jgi:hypothetical protein
MSAITPDRLFPRLFTIRLRPKMAAAVRTPLRKESQKRRPIAIPHRVRRVGVIMSHPLRMNISKICKNQFKFSASYPAKNVCRPPPASPPKTAQAAQIQLLLYWKGPCLARRDL